MKFKKLILTTIMLSVILFATSCGKKEFTVKFDSSGGTTVESVVVEKNKTVTKPADPYKENYVFVRWELDNKEFDFSTKIKKDITLVAVYREISEDALTVSFNPANGDEITTQKVEENDIARKPNDPVREGYTFLYWMLDNKEFDFDTKITKDITLVAKWERDEGTPSDKLTIRFNSDGGSNVKNQTIDRGSRITRPKNPTKEGYTFLGWYSGDTLWNFNWTTNVNLTLKAKWLKVEVPTEPVQDKYAIKVVPVDNFSPQSLVYVYKNNIDITSSVEKLVSGDFVLGLYSTGTKSIKINNAQFENYKNKTLSVIIDGKTFDITEVRN